MASPFPEMTSGLTRNSDSVMNGGPLLSGPRFRSLDVPASGLHCFRIDLPRFIAAHGRESATTNTP